MIEIKINSKVGSDPVRIAIRGDVMINAYDARITALLVEAAMHYIIKERSLDEVRAASEIFRNVAGYLKSLGVSRNELYTMAISAPVLSDTSARH